MDIWDELINNQREEFEEEPLNGHFERFGEKLTKSGPKMKRPLVSGFLKAAAVLIIILLSGNLILQLRNSKQEIKETAMIKSDLGEATFYYTSKINSGIRDLEKMAGEGIGSKQEIVQIRQELSEMDSLFVNLKQEYQTNPNDERIINAMIEYYQTKLEIVNTIKTDLEKVKQLKNKGDENTEI
jgi:hypothetical protein